MNGTLLLFYQQLRLSSPCSLDYLFLWMDMNILTTNITSTFSTVWKFQNFSATNILREINFGEFWVSKISHFDSFRRSEFQFCKISTMKKCKNFKKSKSSPPKFVKRAIFEISNSAKLDFTKNLSGRKILQFLHCE